MQKEQIVYFQTLNMGWVVSEHTLRQIDSGSFSRRSLGEMSLNPEGQTGSDTKTGPHLF
jgi:hypothetical protein